MSIINMLIDQKSSGFIELNSLNIGYFNIFYAVIIELTLESQMNNRQNSTLNKSDINLADYFKKPGSPRQRQYETIRAIAIDGESIKVVAKRYGYKISTIYSLLRDAKAGKTELFPSIKKGPQKKRTKLKVQMKIIELRKMNLSAPDIQDRLAEESIEISSRTVERILKDAGFGKLKRRTNKELGKTVKNKIIPERSEHINFSELVNFLSSSKDKFALANFKSLSNLLSTRFIECELNRSKSRFGILFSLTSFSTKYLNSFTLFKKNLFSLYIRL